MNEYQQNKEGLSRQTKEALLYIKTKVDAAQSFINAIRVRVIAPPADDAGHGPVAAPGLSMVMRHRCAQ